MALVSRETQETVERWQFEIQTIDPSSSSRLKASQPNSSQSSKPKPQNLTPTELARSDHDMQAEALQILRQIFSSVTFMPQLQPGQCQSRGFSFVSYSDV